MGDRYVMFGFGAILVIGLCLGLSSLLQWNGVFDDSLGNLTTLEYFGTWSSIIIWIAAHLLASYLDFYIPWETIYAGEHQKLMNIWSRVVNERKAINALLEEGDLD